MAEPSRAFKSLRKKRPDRPKMKISGPVSQTSISSEQSEHAAKMQRRMSQKLMQPITLGDAPAVPALPTLSTFQNARVPPSPKPHAGAGDGKVQLDMSAIEDPNLDADAYVLSILRDASAEQMEDYESALARIQNRNSVDITESVHKNVDAFINVSVEAKNIKGEMDNLRNYMSELRILISQNNAALGIETEETSSSRRHAHRSSIANLEAMWNTHLQELWKRVEGSQKFLPAIPGRHIVHESGKWIELNSATLKPRRRVHLILLNDHLLVASEKTRTTASPQIGDGQSSRPNQTTQLVTDHCWPLQDVDISELNAKPGQGSNPSRGANQDPSRQAINIRVGNDSLTYAANDRDGREKASLLGRIRKASADLRKALHLDNEEKVSTNRPVSSRTRDSLTRPFSTADSVAAKAKTLVEVDGRQETFRWVEGQVYELEIDVALQRFEEAIARVEKLRNIAKTNKSNPAVQELVNGKAQRHVDKLVEWLCHYLDLDQKAHTKVIRYTAWLSRLELEQLASQKYLQARSDWIQYLTDKTTYEGDITLYMYQISYAYFNSIKNTIKVYNESFSSQMSSACITWAQQQVERFNEHQTMHINCSEVTNEQKDRCMQQTKEHAKMLAEVNVDFSWMIGQAK